MNDYQVLNIRVKYTGGVVVYFNGNKVARFNLIDAFDASTESIEVHDATAFSKFHIILATAGVQEGTNVIAFEIHRPKGTSSSEPVVFDATGVFGLNDCSTVVDTYSSLTSTLTASNLANVMDLDPYTTATPGNVIGTFIEWIVENLEGTGVSISTQRSILRIPGANPSPPSSRLSLFWIVPSLSWLCPWLWLDSARCAGR